MKKHYTHETISATELGSPPKSGFPIKNLAELLKSLPSLEDDAADMAQDLKAIKNNAKLPGNPWD